MKILILENNEHAYKQLFQQLSETFKTEVQLYPKPDQTEPKIEWHWHFLENFVQLSKFEEIITHYSAIDLFIIDVNLTGDKDNIGKNFFNFLEEKKYHDDNFKVIEISTGGSEINSHRSQYVKKEGYWIPDVVDGIKEYYPNLKVHSSSKQFNFFKVGAWFNKFTFFTDQKDYGLLVAFYRQGLKIDASIRWLIHIMICLLYYVLSALSIGFAFKKMWALFSPYLFEKNLIPEEPAQEELKIFTIIEDIFLYSLPVFILLGFYSYYQTNVKVYLLNGNRGRIEDEISTRPMNLTKSIFISSTFSFLTIKSINLVFSEGPVSNEKLYGSGILLIILMAYYFILQRKH